MENTKALENPIQDLDAWVRTWSTATHGGQMGQVCREVLNLKAQLAERDAQLAAVKAVASSLDEILNITNDEDFGDLEERLEEAFSREDIIRDANEALARYKLATKAVK